MKQETLGEQMERINSAAEVRNDVRDTLAEYKQREKELLTQYNKALETVANVIKERDEAHLRLKESEACCAQMREALLIWKPVRDQILSPTISAIAFDNALSFDCGKDWHSPGDWYLLKEQVRVSDEAFNFHIGRANGLSAKCEALQLRLKEAEEDHDKEIGEFQSIVELLTIRLKEAEALLNETTRCCIAPQPWEDRRDVFLATVNAGGKP